MEKGIQDRPDLAQTAGARWIWAEEDTSKANQYAEFRRVFSADSDSVPCSLIISADKDYVVWINGCFTGCGQYADYPAVKTCDRLDLTPFVKAGENVLSVLVYCDNEDSLTYRKGLPGLWYVLSCGETLSVSDERTLARRSPAYTSGPVPRITMQLSFTYIYDARASDSWQMPEYQTGTEWRPALVCQRVIEGSSTVIRPRPVPKLQIKERIPAIIVAQGRFLRPQVEKERSSVARLMQTDYLSPLLPKELFPDNCAPSLPADPGIRLPASGTDGQTGYYLILDLGREEAGLFAMELDAAAGTVVDIGYGQHLDDLRVRSFVGGRNFANRYICRDGRQRFTHYTTRLGGRYIQLHISNSQDTFTLYYAGLIPTEYPIAIKGSFHCANTLWNQIYNVSIRTLHLCMHEHYEDTPWREQALYSMDSRNEALCGYYCFGEYDFPEASLDLLGRGLRDDGYLELCAPARIPITIPAFSLAWILELADHLLCSGRMEPVRRALPRVRAMLAAYRANWKDNLLLSPRGSQYWQFYEWADGLDGQLGGRGLETDRWDAPLNAFYVLALDAAAWLFRLAGEDRLADDCAGDAQKVRQAIPGRFWDDREQAFRTYAGMQSPPHFAQLTQALILCAGACPEDRAARLRQRLTEDDGRLVQTTLSFSFYLFEALLQEPDQYADYVLQKIEQDWGYMLYQGATSFWETIKGADDFAQAGSLCHGWSAIPVYFYQAYVLGIKPLEPGFRTFSLAPAGTVPGKISGTVPTPHGAIEVTRSDEHGTVRCQVTHPQDITCRRSPQVQETALQTDKENREVSK